MTQGVDLGWVIPPVQGENRTERLARFKTLRDFIFLSQLARNEMSKALKRELASDFI